MNMPKTGAEHSGQVVVSHTFDVENLLKGDSADAQLAVQLDPGQYAKFNKNLSKQS